MESLSRAIETYTAEVVRKSPRAFHHRDANLRYAVERALYFWFVNDDSLYEQFRGSQDGPFDLPIASASVVQLAREACHRLKRRMGRKAALQPARAARELGRVDRPPVLVHVIHEKFVRYLHPVLAELAVPYAFLVATGHDLRRELETRGLPFVDCAALERRVLPLRWPSLGFAFPEIVRCYDAMHAALSLLKPTCVILAEGNAPEDEVMNRACQALRVETICLQQGWSPIVHSGFRNMSYTKMAVWGDGFRDLLRPHNPNQDFVVTGHPALRAGSAARIVGDGPGRAIAFFLQAPGRLILDEAWRTFLTLIVATSREFSSHEIVVREHPGRPLEDAERALFTPLPNVRIVSSEPLEALLQRIDISVSIYSTVLLESTAAGALPVVVNLTSIPSYWPDIAAAGAGLEVRSADDALVAIRRLVLDHRYRRSFKPAIDRFATQYFESTAPVPRRFARLVESRLARQHAAPDGTASRQLSS